MSERIMVMKENNVVQIDTAVNNIKFTANEYVKEFMIENIQTKVDVFVNVHPQLDLRMSKS